MKLRICGVTVMVHNYSRPELPDTVEKQLDGIDDPAIEVTAYERSAGYSGITAR